MKVPPLFLPFFFLLEDNKVKLTITQIFLGEKEMAKTKQVNAEAQTQKMYQVEVLKDFSMAIDGEMQLQETGKMIDMDEKQYKMMMNAVPKNLQLRAIVEMQMQSDSDMQMQKDAEEKSKKKSGRPKKKKD